MTGSVCVGDARKHSSQRVTTVVHQSCLIALDFNYRTRKVSDEHFHQVSLLNNCKGSTNRAFVLEIDSGFENFNRTSEYSMFVSCFADYSSFAFVKEKSW